MVHNTVTKAAETFQSITGFDVEDMLVDLFYWFDESTKRKNELVEFCSFCNTEYRQIVKDVSTCWLSLESPVEQSLTQYAALNHTFYPQKNHKHDSSA